MNKVLLLLAGILILINVGWIWKFFESKSDFREKMSHSDRWVTNLTNELETDRTVLNTMILADNQSFPSDLTVTTLGGSFTSIKQILGNQARLVLYFSDSHCISCLEQILINLRKLVPEGIMDNVVVLFSRTDSSMMKWNKLRVLLPAAGFYELSGHLSQDLEEIDHPFICMNSEDLKMQVPMILYPSDEIPIKSYVEFYCVKYFSEKTSQ